MDTYKMESNLRMISCDAIKSDAFVVGDVDTVVDNVSRGHGRSKIYMAEHVIVIKQKRLWASMFVHHDWNTL